MSMHNNNQNENYPMVLNQVFRSDSFGYYYNEQSYMMMEKRQLFLRSYQFSRKKTLTERIKGSLVGAKRIIWLRIRSARKWRKIVRSRFMWAFYCRRRMFLRLLNHYYFNVSSNSCSSSSSSSSCFR